MATKWNGFLYRPWAKALSFMLALAMSMAFLLLGSGAFTGTYQAWDGLFSQEFTQTSNFEHDVGVVINCAAQMLQRFISEEAMNDGAAFAPEKDARLDQLEKDIIRTIQQYENGLQDYIRGSQSHQDYYEPAYEPMRGEAATTSVYNYNYNQGLNDDFYTVLEGEIVVDEEAIRHTLTEGARQDIRRMEAVLRSDYEFAKEWLEGTTSLQYAVIDMADGRVYTNMAGEKYQEAVESMPWYAYKTGGWGSVHMGGAANLLYVYEHNVNYCVGFDEEAALAMAKPDRLASMAQSFHDVQQKRVPVLAAMALLLVLCCLCALHLILVTGRRSKNGPVALGMLDRVWNLLHWGGGAFLWFIAMQWIASRHYSSYPDRQIGLLTAALVTLLILPELVLSIARHAKNKTVLKNTLWYQLWQRLRNVRPRSMKRSTLWILIGFAAWFLLAGFISAAFAGSRGDLGLLVLALMVIAGGVAAYFLLLKHTTALDEIRTALQQTRQGNLASELNPEPMPAGMKALAEGILDMRQGMDAAVRQAVAGERMRTELITNVSHDLKTPLTSVINYVDLLRREDITEEERGDYLLTLAQKSEQLGRLVEDLVEASKASSGNVELHPVEVNLQELALQAVGENSDALAAQGIELIIQAPGQPPVVWADSQKTWRIIENLMSNVMKYTMPGTRVYLQLACEGGFGGLVVKNISSAPLNIPAQELTQRFVRGDMARSGGGSGLGLSIADSLCKVQGGRFELQVDGDLFKAGIWLPEAG